MTTPSACTPALPPREPQFAAVPAVVRRLAPLAKETADSSAVPEQRREDAPRTLHKSAPGVAHRAAVTGCVPQVYPSRVSLATL